MGFSWDGGWPREVLIVEKCQVDARCTEQLGSPARMPDVFRTTDSSSRTPLSICPIMYIMSTRVWRRTSAGVRQLPLLGRPALRVRGWLIRQPNGPLGLGPLALLLLLGLFTLGAGCRKATSPATFAGSAGEGDGGRAPEFVSERFDELYPIFLLEKVSAGEKAALWRRYQGKWVEWTSRVASITATGLTFREASVLSYDISLEMDAAARPARVWVHPGQHVTFIGQLERYDDVGKAFYLRHGSLVPARD